MELANTLNTAEAALSDLQAFLDKLKTNVKEYEKEAEKRQIDRDLAQQDLEDFLNEIKEANA